MMITNNGKSVPQAGVVVLQSGERIEVHGAPTLIFEEQKSGGEPRIVATATANSFTFAITDFRPGDRLLYKFNGFLQSGEPIKGVTICERVGEFGNSSIYQVSYTISIA